MDTGTNAISVIVGFIPERIRNVASIAIEDPICGQFQLWKPVYPRLWRLHGQIGVRILHSKRTDGDTYLESSSVHQLVREADSSST